LFALVIVEIEIEMIGTIVHISPIF